ncbi:hypothetical protein GCM10010371_25350 [Streptomyces subrutilus]|nr:protein kinase [Streptomyces subrutilus]GGZ64618.1 hypothetical protein GCM10010371_25350 [Streptomyces subrutilus]
MKPLETGDPTSVGGGRYRLVGRLGQGGMGVVYLGRSPSGRAVAVKVVRPELSTEPGFRRRFADEVAAARRVGGFHTAPVVDADPEGEPAWLVTAFVPGPTLRTVLARVGSLPVDTLTVLAAGLAEALEAIHRAGIMHRDLKPANIIVAEDGPRVIDFGIARALDGTALTQTGLQIGTPGFLAPEQLTGGAVTPAVDMFALGVVLAQAAGGAPFGDGPSAARHYRAVHEEPDLEGVPDELCGAVAACLAKDPGDRPTPTAFLGGLTVRHPAGDHWLPEAATLLLPDPQTPRAPRAAAGVEEGAGGEGGGGGRQGAGGTAPDPADPADPAAPDRGTGPEGVAGSGRGPGAGPGPGATAAPAAAAPAAVGPYPVEPPGRGAVSAPGAGRARRGRTAVGAGVLVGLLAAGGLAAWQPWHGTTDDGAAPGADGPPATATATGPAPFPTAPLLVRLDTAPGWPGTCHGVIAGRDAATDAPRQLVAGDACDVLPQWSPDHASFAFTRTTATGTAVWTAKADGSQPRRIAAIAGGRVSWSPDGTRLAVLRLKDGVQQLFAVAVADGAARQLTTGTGPVEDPAWSPDGRHVAVSLQTAPDDWQIHLVDPDAPGGAPRQVTRLPHPALDAVWSPDGTTFAYTAGTYGAGTQGDIRLVGADGAGDRALVATDAHEMDPAWSPDGKWVAFVRGPYEKPAVWAVRADATGERLLTTASTSEAHPAWR